MLSVPAGRLRRMSMRVTGQGGARSGGLTGGVWAWCFPGACPGCGARAEGLCPACLADARRPDPALPPPGLACWHAPFAYEGAVREAVAGLKYRNRRSVLAFLADAVATELVCVRRAPEPIVVTWVPTTRRRRAERGFDHAELLARAVAHRLGLPARPMLRRLDGVAQTGRSALERRRGPSLARLAESGSRPRSVVIVDDVTTTGASLGIAAQTLLNKPDRRVIGASVARTPLKANGVHPDRVGEARRSAGDGRRREGA